VTGATATVPDVDLDPPGIDPEDDAAFDAWSVDRDRRLANAHVRWRRAGRPSAGLVDLIAQALDLSPWDRHDVARWLDHAARVGRPPVIGDRTLTQLARVDLIPNEAPRDAYTKAVESGALTPSTIARRVGYVTDRPEIAGVERALGIAPGDGDAVRLFIPYDVGVTFAYALGLDPHAAGV
jgi:hypothetical protein